MKNCLLLIQFSFVRTEFLIFLAPKCHKDVSFKHLKIKLTCQIS